MTPIIRLNESHLETVIALHHEVIRDIPPELVARETDAFFRDHMASCGQIFGAFENDRLIAYGVLGLPRPGDPNFGRDHGLADDQLPRVAHIDGVGVRAEHRGQRWQQRLVQHRLEAARTAGRGIALSTVAPGNLASVVSTLSAGLSIQGVIDKFGGKRFLLRRDLADQGVRGGSPIDPTEISIWCSCNDLVRCKELLNAGHIGVNCRKAAPEAIPEIGWRQARFMQA